jgi:hypothetical protein
MDTPPPPASRDFSELERRVLAMLGEHMPAAFAGYVFPPGQQVRMTCEAMIAGAASLLARAECMMVLSGAAAGLDPSQVADAVEAAEQRVILNARRWAQDFQI